jgi:hypothetical protein
MSKEKTKRAAWARPCDRSDSRKMGRWVTAAPTWLAFVRVQTQQWSNSNRRFRGDIFLSITVSAGCGSGVAGYNVQVAIDIEHHLIVTHEVTNVGNNTAHFANVAGQAKAVLQVQELEAVADRGYYKSEEILARIHGMRRPCESAIVINKLCWI